jgi:hypothetical protein
MATQRVLITGAGGNMGRMLSSRLVAPGRQLRLLDIGADPEPAAENTGSVETIVASVTDLEALSAACDGIDAVIHLGGISKEAPFEEILEVNVRGTYCVLEAARRQGVGRVVLASSNHAVGYASRSDAGPDGLAADIPARPDSFYGWSKATNEALGSLYVDTYGMDVFCIRIGSSFDEPFDVRSLATWMSPDDTARLMEACLTTTQGGFRLIWGISPNTRRWWDMSAGEEIGYQPVDDSERYAEALIAEFGAQDPNDPVHHLVGGKFCAVPLGERMV